MTVAFVFLYWTRLCDLNVISAVALPAARFGAIVASIYARHIRRGDGDVVEFFRSGGVMPRAWGGSD